MAKKKAKLKDDNWDQFLDSAFEDVLQGVATQLQRADLDVEQGGNLVGVPLPALSLRYLFRCTVLPLSRVIHVFGLQGSCKTAFLIEVMRWHHLVGGISFYCHNENKDSPDLRKAILQWDERWIKHHQMVPASTVEEWELVLTTFLKEARKLCDSVGKRIPIAIGLDSLTGVATSRHVKKVSDEGFLGRDFADMARAIADYVRTLPNFMLEYPFTLVVTNHDKPSQDQYGNPVHHTPGGKAMRFAAAWEVLMSRTSSRNISRADYEGVELKFYTTKNSIGPGQVGITGRFLWRYDQDGRQHMWWDWATGSLHLLLSFNAPGKKEQFKRIQEIVPLEQKRGLYVCKDLGFSSPAPAEEVYEALEADKERMESLYRVLGINPGLPYKLGDDYEELLYGSNR